MKSLKDALERLRAARRAQAEIHEKLSQEIAERKQMEEALRENQEKFEGITASAKDAIILLDYEGKICYWNKAAEGTLGYSAREAIGKEVHIFFAPERYHAAYRKGYLNFRETGEGPVLGKTLELEAIRKDGKKFPIELSVSAVKLQGRWNAIGVLRDVTERKHMEEGLRQANDKLQTTLKELEQYNRETVLLSEMSDLLQSSACAEEAYAIIARCAQRLFPNESGALFTINPSQNLVEAVTAWGGSLAGERVFAPAECWGLRRGQVHRVEDLKSGLICSHLGQRDKSSADENAALLSGGYICVPMMAQGGALGILHLQSRDGREQMTESKQQLAVNVSERIALALANLRLHETLRSQSIRDPLTGLFNRRYMEESLERELRRAARKQQTVEIIMMDIDYFKRFNDAFGRDGGDAFLRELGALLRKAVREEDIACRYGGEEFIVILPETSLEITRQRAERLRELAKHIHVERRRQTLGSITLSCGVAMFPQHGTITETLRHAADTALYHAKHSGRDRVEVAGSVE